MKVNAKVMLAKCKSEEKLYGIRIQQKGNDWVRTWAFPIKQDMAKSEGFDQTNVNGSFLTTDDYPGCPFCGAKNFFVCAKCHKINCYNGEGAVTCAWCKSDSVVSRLDTLDVDAGGY